MNYDGRRTELRDYFYFFAAVSLNITQRAPEFYISQQSFFRSKSKKHIRTGRAISSSGDQSWPPRSYNLTPLDFWLEVI